MNHQDADGDNLMSQGNYVEKPDIITKPTSRSVAGLLGGLFVLSISLHWYPIHCVSLRHFLRQFCIGVHGVVWYFMFQK